MNNYFALKAAESQLKNLMVLRYAENLHLAKSLDPSQSARTTQADMGRYSLAMYLTPFFQSRSQLNIKSASCRVSCRKLPQAVIYISRKALNIHLISCNTTFLTHYQTTNFRLAQIETVCRRES